MCTCVYLCMCVCVYLCMCVCAHMCVYVYVCTCVYRCVSVWEVGGDRACFVKYAGMSKTKSI